VSAGARRYEEEQPVPEWLGTCLNYLVPALIGVAGLGILMSGKFSAQAMSLPAFFTAGREVRGPLAWVTGLMLLAALPSAILLGPLVGRALGWRMPEEIPEVEGEKNLKLVLARNDQILDQLTKSRQSLDAMYQGVTRLRELGLIDPEEFRTQTDKYQETVKQYETHGVMAREQTDRLRRHLEDRRRQEEADRRAHNRRWEAQENILVTLGVVLLACLLTAVAGKHPETPTPSVPA
jgi:hypothetical protein